MERYQNIHMSGHEKDLVLADNDFDDEKTGYTEGSFQTLVLPQQGTVQQ